MRAFRANARRTIFWGPLALLLFLAGVAQAQYVRPARMSDTGGITSVPGGTTLAANLHTGTTFRATAPATVTITNATNATPIVVTATAHGLVTGDNISISGITGNTNANGYFKVTRLSADTFSLQNYSTGVDIAGNGAYGGAPVAVTGIVQAARVMVAAGQADAPGFSSYSFPTSGFFFNDANGRPSAGIGGVKYMEVTTSGLDLFASTGAIRLGASLNATLRRTATGEITVGSSLALNDGVLQLNKVVRNSTSGAQASSGVSTELLTIAAAASTDTTANLLPADAYIEAVTVNVVTLIPTAATFTVGDATTAARFATGVAVAAGTKAVGLTHVDQTGDAGPKQTTAAKVRITPNASPAAATGVVRVDVFWRLYAAGTT